MQTGTEPPMGTPNPTPTPEAPPASFRDRALEYAAAGIPVFPCKAGDKTPISVCTPNGFKDATTDATRITQWWTPYPEANIAAPVAADEVLIDVDPKNGGDESFVRLEEKSGELPRTFTVRTGSGGSHRRYKYSGAPV